MAPTAHRSYAERVMTSMNILQRGKKNGNIHLASLRSHIKKTAAEKKEKLGPQWTKWVSNAIEKLVTEGIVSHTDPGMVAFSYTGRKSINAARRSLLPSQAPGTPVQPERLAKEVIKSTHKRRSTFHRIEDDPASPTRQIKRPRRSTRLTKPTEAETLLERKKQADRTLRSMRSDSPLTDVSDDSDTEIEIQPMQQQQQHAEETARINQDFEETREQGGSETQMENTFTAPSTSARSVEAITPRPASTCRRTQSGSMTRPPTPPKSPGRSSPMDEDDADIQVPSSDPFGPTSPQAPTSLQRINASLTNEVADLKHEAASLEGALRTAQENEKDTLFENASLRETILADQTTIAELQLQLEKLYKDHESLESDVESLIGEKNQLATDNASLRQTVSYLDSDAKASISRLEATNAEQAALVESLSLEKEQLEIASKEEVDALRRTVSEHDSTIVSLRLALQTSADEHNAYVSQLESDIANLTDVVASQRDTTSSVESQLKSLHRSLEEVTVERIALKSQLESVNNEKSDLAGLVAEQQTALEKLNTELAEARLVQSGHLEALVDTQQQLAVASNSLETLRNEYASKSAEAVDLASALNEHVVAVDDLTRLVDGASVQIDVLQNDLLTKERASKALQDESEMRIGNLEALMSDLRASYQEEISRRGDAEKALDEALTTSAKLSAQVNIKTSECASLMESIHIERERGTSLTNDLGDARRRAENAEQEIVRLQVAMSDRETTISRMKETFETFKITTLQALAVAEGQMLPSSEMVTQSMS